MSTSADSGQRVRICSMRPVPSLRLAALLLLGWCAWSLGGLLDFFEAEKSEFPTEYGVDVTFPIHRGIDRRRHALYARRYDRLMHGCYERYGRYSCEATEQARMAMNLQQPPRQHNYTAVGFQKTRLPQSAWAPLLAFFEQHRSREAPEDWPPGNTYVNHWEAPSAMVSFEDTRLRGGLRLKQLLWQTLQPIVEAWVGYPVEPSSLYGIRVYKRGAVLATHVDRLPLVSSAIVQVAQQLDDAPSDANDTQQCGEGARRVFSWPLEVYDHAGRARNVSMCPGDVVLYESHTVLHGRPFALRGDAYANVFVHFKPRDHDALNLRDKELGSAAAEAREGRVGGHEQTNHRAAADAFRRRFKPPPPRDDAADAAAVGEAASADEVDNDEWRRWLASVARCDDAALETQLLRAAATLGGAAVARLVRSGRDARGWTLLHEAVRAQCVPAAARLLRDYDADPLAAASGAKDARWLAAQLFADSAHPLRRLLDAPRGAATG